jgi:threonine dehydrogenase-like Zn-dependent dehydrogenase
VDQIRESLGEGADVVVDLVPGPQQGIADDIALVRRGGRVVVAGVKTQDTAVTVPSLDFLSKEITVRGVWARPDWAVAWSLELLAREEALSDLVEAAHSLGEVEEALLAMQGGDRRPLHSVVNPSDGR